MFSEAQTPPTLGCFAKGDFSEWLRIKCVMSHFNCTKWNPLQHPPTPPREPMFPD